MDLTGKQQKVSLTKPSHEILHNILAIYFHHMKYPDSVNVVLQTICRCLCCSQVTHLSDHMKLTRRTDSLKDYFSQFGEVSECTVMRDSATGRSRGFGFLTFKDPKCVNIVMVKEHYLDGKIVRI